MSPLVENLPPAASLPQAAPLPKAAEKPTLPFSSRKRSPVLIPQKQVVPRQEETVPSLDFPTVFSQNEEETPVAVAPVPVAQAPLSPSTTVELPKSVPPSFREILQKKLIDLANKNASKEENEEEVQASPQAQIVGKILFWIIWGYVIFHFLRALFQ